MHSESLILINAQHLSISQGHLLIFEMPFKIVQSIYMQFISLHIFQNAQCKDVIIWHSPNLYLATSLYNRGHTFYLNNLFKFEFCTCTARLRGQFTTRPSLSFLLLEKMMIRRIESKQQKQFTIIKQTSLTNGPF